MKNTIAFALIVLSTACAQPVPSQSLEEAGLVPQFLAVRTAWYNSDALPDMPYECRDLRVRYVPSEDLDGDLGMLDGNVVVMQDGLDQITEDRVFVHVATHWLVECTGFVLELDEDSELRHANLDVWGVNGVQDNALAGIGLPRFTVAPGLAKYEFASGMCADQGRVLANVMTQGALQALLILWANHPEPVQGLWVNGTVQNVDSPVRGLVLARGGALLPVEIENGRYSAAAACELPELTID